MLRVRRTDGRGVPTPPKTATQRGTESSPLPCPPEQATIAAEGWRDSRDDSAKDRGYGQSTCDIRAYATKYVWFAEFPLSSY